MQPYPLLLQPVFVTESWSGNVLSSLFSGIVSNSNDPKYVGEAWILSACECNYTKILNGPLAESALSSSIQIPMEWFGLDNIAAFPLLIKVLDAGQDLPVHVHISDFKQTNYSKRSQANTKFWYVLAAKPDAYVVYGHSAQTKSEFRNFMENNDWDDLFVKQNVKQGDFFYIPSGTLHALGKGVVVFEVEEGNTAPFCLFDGNDDSSLNVTKLDQNERSLEMEEAIKQVNYPSRLPDVQPNHWEIDNTKLTRFISCDYFIVEKWEINDSFQTTTEQKFRFGFVIEGQGELNTQNHSIQLTKGTSFLLPAPLCEFELQGTMTILIVYLPHKKNI